MRQKKERIELLFKLFMFCYTVELIGLISIGVALFTHKEPLIGGIMTVVAIIVQIIILAIIERCE